MKNRFVLVHYIPKMDYFTLVSENWGSRHFDVVAEAVEACRVLQPQLKAKLGYEEVKVIEAECYDHGDCCRTIFDPEYVKQNEVLT